MTHVVRTLLTALAAVALACDPGGATGATRGDVDESALSVLAGRWTNIDAETNARTRMRVRVQDGVAVFESWGACSPVECYWGYTLADASAWASHRRLHLEWRWPALVTTDTIFLEAGPRLRVRSHTHFTDASGRADLFIEETFVTVP